MSDISERQGARSVMSVLGPVAAEDLGRVLMHEHILISLPGDELDPRSPWTREGCVRTAVERMLELSEHGCAHLSIHAQSILAGIPPSCERSRAGDVQIDILRDGGADLSRCLIGHQDQQQDLEQLREIARAGANIGFDRIGFGMLAPDEQRADHIAALVGEGYVNQICLSQDHACSFRPFRPARWVPKDKLATYMRDIHPRALHEITGRSHAHIFTDFLPLLRDRGVSDEQIEIMLVDTPRRILTGS
jgi:predicted metal-dependent phosphotriesterase family hydrolase